MSAEKERRDEETIKRLDAALNKALDEVTELNNHNNHRIMVLQAEIRARSAAAEILQQEKDALEISLRRSKEEIRTLKGALETIEQGMHLDEKSQTMEAQIARRTLEEFPHHAESVPAEPGMS